MYLGTRHMIKVSRFYLTDEECKLTKASEIAQAAKGFYLTDEECKGNGIVS